MAKHITIQENNQSETHNETEIIVQDSTKNRNPAIVYLSTLAKSSRRTTRTALNNIAQIFNQDVFEMPWGELRFEHTAFIRGKLIEVYAPATVNRHLSALRNVLKACRRLGYMNADELADAIDISNVKNHKSLSGRRITDEELVRALNICTEDDSDIGIRDAAMFALMWTTGLRRQEVVNLKMKNYKPENDNEIQVIRGKGNKDRSVHLHPKAVTLLQKWFKIRGKESGAIFTRTKNHSGEHLSDQTVYDRIKKRFSEAGIDDISPHNFRHTYISNLFDKNIDAATIADLSGHSDIKTTKSYDRRGDERKKKATHALDFPE